MEVRTIPTQYPEFRDNLRDELSVVEHPHRRALRDRHGVRSARYRGGSNVAATKPQGHLQVVRYRVDIASRREDHTLVRYHERPVQLGELFERLAQVHLLGLHAKFVRSVLRLTPRTARPHYELADASCRRTFTTGARRGERCRSYLTSLSKLTRRKARGRLGPESFR